MNDPVAAAQRMAFDVRAMITAMKREDDEPKDSSPSDTSNKSEDHKQDER